ncbi:MAG: glycosyltransferase family 4 protein [Paludibacteraceae bacterium]|nr:glycosyltransferase family 4 protein [Paludibacteraceae bacterium]
MRIVYCIPHLYNSGGMERVLTQKVNWLAAHTDYEITIVTTELTPVGQNDVCFSLDERVQVVRLNIDFNADYHKPLLSKYIGHARRLRAYKRALINYIRANEIDLCISLGGKEVAFISTLPCRTIVEFHFAKDHRQQLLDANHTGWFWHVLGRIRTWQLVRDVRSVGQIVVLTEKDKQDWQQAGCTNVMCIPNPCAIKYRVVSSEYRVQGSEYGEQGVKTLLAVGRLHEQKGFDMLLEAWNNVQRDNVQCTKDWTLRIVGEGEQRKKLEEQIRDLHLSNVVLAGRVENVVEEYNAASLFVLSSRYEGLPLALIEAMWCGVPCVSFDCPHGPAELLEDDRGWLVPAMDVEKLAQQIIYAMTHMEEALERAQRAQEYAYEKYSEASIMPQWVQLIENI